MPAYYTHAIFADKFYEDNKKDYAIFKEEIGIADLKTYSLGIDLSEFASPKIDSHNNKTKIFLLSMIKKIKDEKLQTNERVMALLYGHILHRSLDINLHPFVYYHEQGMKNNSPISSHNYFEGYLNYYFADKIKNIDLKHLRPNYFNEGNLKDKDCQNIINSTYKKVYKINNVSSAYQTTLNAMAFLETALANLDKRSLKALSGFNKLVSLNNLTPNDFHNEAHNDWLHPITGTVHHASVYDLFKDAIADACLKIHAVNEYLYGEKSFSYLEKYFDNTSYDTGVSCKIPKEFKYVKKYNSK